MADTGSQKYSIREALNRIVRVLIGKPAPYDAPDTLSGSVLSVDEALSKLAEVMEGNDSEESFVLPGSTSIEDITVTDWITARGITSTEIYAGTGTFYAGYGRVSIGGLDDDSDNGTFGGGYAVLAFAPAGVIPSGTLSHLGGVLFAEGGSLKYLGASGTVTVLAGS